MYGPPRPPTTSRRRRRLRRALTIAIAAVAVLVVVLLVLIADGVLVLPGHSASPVTISYVQIRVLEGNTSAGTPWFGVGSPEKNYTSGYPAQLTAGSTVDVPTFFLNYDTNYTHTLRTVTATTIPKEYIPITQTVPALPIPILPWSEEPDGQNFLVYVTLPSTPGATYVLIITVSAIAPS
ncbi:MAG TPA: hypothetical protein VEG66_09480 [Thermoplasmata archaeon]|jgi:hypothetical protein|nr:hypothetical protein [Thermoplasmata archaeon]